MQEIWKTVPNFSNYQVSNFGNVKSLKKEVKTKGGSYRTLKEKNIKCSTRKNGYLYVNLYNEAICKKYNVHRLVAMLFLPNPDNLPQVNHIDGNKTNNNSNNLEWCSQSHNMKEAYRLGLETKSNVSPVNQYDLNGNFVKSWGSIKEAQKQYGLINISECCRNKRKTAGGYIWRYADK